MPFGNTCEDHPTLVGSNSKFHPCKETLMDLVPMGELSIQLSLYSGMYITTIYLEGRRRSEFPTT